VTARSRRRLGRAVREHLLVLGASFLGGAGVMLALTFVYELRLAEIAAGF
jgi:hypothetical protein